MPTKLRGVTAALVPHGDAQAPWVEGQGYRYSWAARVDERVEESLASAADQSPADRKSEDGRRPLVPYRHVDTPAPELTSQPPNCDDDIVVDALVGSGEVEDGRADLGHRLSRQPLDLGDPLADHGRTRIHPAPLRVHPDGEHPLCDAVVELPSEAFTLGLDQLTLTGLRQGGMSPAQLSVRSLERRGRRQGLVTRPRRLRTQLFAPREQEAALRGRDDVIGEGRKQRPIGVFDLAAQGERDDEPSADLLLPDEWSDEGGST